MLELHSLTIQEKLGGPTRTFNTSNSSCSYKYLVSGKVHLFILTKNEINRKHIVEEEKNHIKYNATAATAIIKLGEFFFGQRQWLQCGTLNVLKERK